MLRTHNCGQLRIMDVDKHVTLCGWVDTRRDHGGVIFIDLRDREGKTQVVFNPEKSKEFHGKAEGLRNEFVIQVKGIVCKRPEGTNNPKMPTGDIEIHVEELIVLNQAVTPPFEISDDTAVTEELRLQYRFIDLRRPAMVSNLRTRHKIFKVIRDHMDAKGFFEVETPILTKSTPEGARDYLVPSRLNPGKFYALPQSPQLFKQILMVSGLDKYYQIAKCFRDEDLRADRQPEFTQLDIEMSFIDENDIFCLVEDVMKDIFKSVANIDLKTPFPRMAHNEAAARFGSDKPDTRFGLEINDITKECGTTEFKVFKNVIERGGNILCINAKKCGGFSRSRIDEMNAFALSEGAKGLSYFKAASGKLDSPIAKFFGQEAVSAIIKKTQCQDGDLLLLVADAKEVAREVMGQIRLRLGRSEKLIDENRFDLYWIVDFPLFKWDEEEKRLDSEHHPFTSPKAEDIGLLDTEPLKARANSYDLVINGMELASGSIRIHQKELQDKIFKYIGIEKDEAEKRFGFLTKAFGYGAPPHGGIAIGLDRFVTLFTKSQSIREVIAFPKTQKAICPMTDAPSDVSVRQLDELSIRIKLPVKEGK